MLGGGVAFRWAGLLCVGLEDASVELTEPDRAVLVASQLFRGLAAADIDALVGAFGLRELPARRAVYRQDEHAGRPPRLTPVAGRTRWRGSGQLCQGQPSPPIRSGWFAALAGLAG